MAPLALVLFASLSSAFAFRSDGKEEVKSIHQHAEHTAAVEASIQLHTSNATGDGMDSAIAQASMVHQQMLKVAKTGITGYAAVNGARCPTSVPGMNMAVEDGYDYGAGCKWQETCLCPNSPYYVCATTGRISNPSGFTGVFISTFGYCRMGWWVFVGGGALVVMLLTVMYFGIMYYIIK
ncbi:unnamed protein product [Effrenium voratum]|uniref:Uncharacterized protein n=1 Tax=Effrenium voratum TaxID=2562239 RepID=A0AA36HRD0_9DINO|nr:unnamed protein product [Effrenium voratum]CAJ1444775.1 unnamed protein product [Effrenium voratum]